VRPHKLTPNFETRQIIIHIHHSKETYQNANSKPKFNHTINATKLKQKQIKISLSNNSSRNFTNESNRTAKDTLTKVIDLKVTDRRKWKRNTTSEGNWAQRRCEMKMAFECMKWRRLFCTQSTSMASMVCFRNIQFSFLFFSERRTQIEEHHQHHERESESGVWVLLWFVLFLV